MEKIEILILDNNNGRLSHMGAAFLHSFDKELYVRPAGIKNEHNIDHCVIKVMKDSGIDLSNAKGLTPKEYTSQNWDYLIIINNCANAFSPVFKGMVLNRIYINFNDDIKQEGSGEFIHHEYTTLREIGRASCRERVSPPV